jgi:hypothetical protein
MRQFDAAVKVGGSGRILKQALPLKENLADYEIILYGCPNLSYMIPIKIGAGACLSPPYIG